MKSLKLAKAATNAVFTEALLEKFVEIDENVTLCLIDPLENNGYMFQIMDLTTQSLTNIDENNLDDLNKVLEIIDCEEFE
jgi:hypothetical protein